MPQELFIDFEREPFDQKMLAKDPEMALKHLISQQSSGHHPPDIIHSVIQLVMSKEDNKLKRLLYYFFETMNREDKSFIICLNQIKKDLAGPNEFIRGIVLKFISTIENIDYVLPLLRDIKENLNDKCAYTRMNAILCLGEIGVRFDLEVENDILDTMKKETTNQVLIVGFNMMNKLGMGFDDFLEIDYPREILEVLVEKNDGISFLARMTESRFSTVSFYASCKLLAKGYEQKTCLENIIRILESTVDLKQDFLPYLKFVDTNSFGLLTLVDAYDYSFSSQIIDTVFKNADTSEFFKIAEFLYQAYSAIGTTSDKKKAFKLLLLDKMAIFSSTHCIFLDELVDNCLKNVLDRDPEIVYSSLNFLGTCTSKEKFREPIHEFLIANFSKLKFGKIIRKCFDVLAENISKENYEKLLDVLLNDMGFETNVVETGEQEVSQDHQLIKHHEFPFYLSKQAEVFVGGHIALCLMSAHDEGWGLRSKLIGTLLRMVEVSEEQSIIDFSSKSTIISCVRSLLAGKKQEVEADRNVSDYTYVNVLKPIEFSLLTTPLVFKKFLWTDPLNTTQSTIQLSGLGDPLYIETNYTHSKYEIVLDLLVINQTSSYLQNISIDFNFSKNIQMVSTIAPFSLQPNGSITLMAQFSILESLASFITATITFKYPKKNDYSGRPFVQNLSEVVFDISTLLEGADINFKDHWKNLEWENIYSITIRKDCKDMLLQIANRINGHMCDKLENYGFVVGNIACYTTQKMLVLINVCISAGQNSHVELRVRSTNEELVKNITGLLSQFLKARQ